MYSSVSKLDRDIACSFLNAPTNRVSYLPLQMRYEQNHMMMTPSESIITKETLFNDVFSQSHPNTRLDFPKHGNIIPMYYDVIIDTVTDYDSKCICFNMPISYIDYMQFFIL